MRRIRRFIVGAGASFGAVAFMCRKPWASEGYGWKHAYLTMFARYELGVLVLAADVRISWRLMSKLVRGNSLSRRERDLLVQTTADIFITVPAAEYIVLTSIDLLRPVLPRLFPKILPPSTLEDKMEIQEPEIGSLKAKMKLKAGREVTKFFLDLARIMVNVDRNLQSGDIQTSADDYFDFVARAARRRPVTMVEVLGFAMLFTNELILNNVSRFWLVEMCKHMGIPQLGTDEYMRFVLQERLKLVKNEDELIQAKGVNSLSEAELCRVCRERGIQVAEDMRQQLFSWMELSVCIPSSVLIMSRTFIVGRHKNALNAVFYVISSFPYEFKLLFGITSLPSNDPLNDKMRKLHCLDWQEQQIKEEEKKVLSEMNQSNAIQEDAVLLEMNTSMPEKARARAINQQEQPFKHIPLNTLAMP